MEVLNKQIEVYPLNNGFVVNGTYYEKVEEIVSNVLKSLNDKRIFTYDNFKSQHKEKIIIDLKMTLK